MSQSHLSLARYRPEIARREPEKASAPFRAAPTLKKLAAQAATHGQSATVE